MLKISDTTLPQSLLSYVAFRVAFRETFERLTYHQKYPAESGETFGYLCEIPFLREVPAQVQLDVLSQTWHRHLSREAHAATLTDESVLYAVCESAARLAELDPATFVKHMIGGPIDLSVPVDAQLARELRLVYLELPNDGDFLLISQFMDLDPSESVRQKMEMGIDPERLDELFDLLGRWHLTPELATRLVGLLTDAEAASVVIGMRAHYRNITHQH